MQSHKDFKDILLQINLELPPESRVSEEEIALVGTQLDQLLQAASHEAAGRLGRCHTLQQKIAALWQAIKDRIQTWVCPVDPRWMNFLNAARDKLRDLKPQQGNQKLIALMILGIGVAASVALVQSLPVIIAVLAILGVFSLVRLAERITRIPEIR